MRPKSALGAWLQAVHFRFLASRRARYLEVQLLRRSRQLREAEQRIRSLEGQLQAALSNSTTDSCTAALLLLVPASWTSQLKRWC